MHSCIVVAPTSCARSDVIVQHNIVHWSVPIHAQTWRVLQLPLTVRSLQAVTAELCPTIRAVLSMHAHM
jgi:hypothetical protein